MKSMLISKISTLIIDIPPESHDESVSNYRETVEELVIAYARKNGLVPEGAKAWIASTGDGDVLVAEKDGKLIDVGKVVLKEEITHRTPHTTTVDTEIYLAL